MSQMGCGGSKAEETGVRAVVGEGTTSAEAPVAAKEMIVATETAASDEVATAAVDVEVPEDKKSFVGDVAKGFSAIGDATVGAVTKTVEVVSDPIGSVGDAAKGVADGTVNLVTDPIGSVGGAIEGTVSGVVDASVAVAEGSVGAVVGVANDTMAAGGAVVDLGAGELKATFSLLGVTAAFQAVFGANIDKSDEGLAKAFASVDADGSGKISSDEMKAYIVSVYGEGLDGEIVTSMMTTADLDGDGEVDLDEFKTIMRAGPESK